MIVFKAMGLLLKYNFSLLFAFVFSANAAFSNPTRGDVEIVRLSQRSNISGEIIVHLGKGVALITERAGTYSILMKAPDWDVLAFNKEKRVQYRAKFKDFSLDYDYASRTARMERFACLKTKNLLAVENIHGFKSNHFCLRDDGAKERAKLWSKDFANVKQMDVWCASRSDIPYEVGTVAQKLYRLPPQNGFPLQVTYITTKNKLIKDLYILNVQKVKVRPEFFKAPEKYKEVKQLSQVMLDMKGAGEMIDLLIGNCTAKTGTGLLR